MNLKHVKMILQLFCERTFETFHCFDLLAARSKAKLETQNMWSV